MSTIGKILGGNEAIILSILKKLKKVSGELDGKPFQKTSLEGSNLAKRIFVCKGWVDTKAGPALRFRVRIGQLSDGQLMYDPDLSGWQDCEEDSIEVDQGAGGLVLKLAFSDAKGKRHKASFSTKIKL
ncbi:hypothetical protein IT575_07725 [bacterium]|nr:hypothetical protein [bacterium]